MLSEIAKSPAIFDDAFENLVRDIRPAHQPQAHILHDLLTGFYRVRAHYGANDHYVNPGFVQSEMRRLLGAPISGTTALFAKHVAQIASLAPNLHVWNNSTGNSYSTPQHVAAVTIYCADHHLQRCDDLHKHFSGATDVLARLCPLVRDRMEHRAAFIRALTPYSTVVGALSVRVEDLKRAIAQNDPCRPRPRSGDVAEQHKLIF